ncbi:30S ribosomal protein S4 [Salisaeta longa]|uniref:30S ribosomal protein S4 n=1 Tax=Salisaeta longa TaxID=503170 RepID=UPI0003B6340A|nr:30S ribosomal protein S4 [Salisaeta longa]
MARYRGPKQKVARRFKEPIFGPSKALERKPYPPGQHGRNRRRRESEYAVQLKEKQKAKYTYGLLERQFKNLFDKATRKQGVTGENLLRFLEARLDNVVFRLGIARTRRQARQFVTHGHIMVNGEPVNIPSYELQADDIVAVRPKSRQLEVIKDNIERQRRNYAWMEMDRNEMKGRFIALPEREEIPENIDEQLIVELYSK